ncbi:MAG TPA: hypothetical protein VHV28_13930 [Solirubrobacteraceae bacterium]|nr:hypothetical protein [Solirubrobacteraceae bacterium]
MVAEPDVLTRNRLLATLPEQELAMLAPEFELVSYGLKDYVHRENEPIEDVAFPTSGCCRWSRRWPTGAGLKWPPSETRAWSGFRSS